MNKRTKFEVITECNCQVTDTQIDGKYFFTQSSQLKIVKSQEKT